MRDCPDILVLGGGGVLGEAWMTGVLAGIEDGAGFRFNDADHFIGTSAGAIIAARLAGGGRLRRPGGTRNLLPAIPEVRFRFTETLETFVPEPVRTLTGAVLTPLGQAASAIAAPATELAITVSAPFAGPALGVSSAPGAFARSAALKALPRPEGNLDALRRSLAGQNLSFDGRLTVTALDCATGRRVLFGTESAPPAEVADAVVASCTVPWLFAPVAIGDAEYVDGGVWSPTNLDAAQVKRGTRVLCLNPTGGLRGPHPLLAVARGASRSLAAVEATALRRRGARVTVVAPSNEAGRDMGANLMDFGPQEEVHAAGYRQGLELAAARG